MVQPRILIVDDDPATVEFLSAFFGDEGFLVDEARDGAQALSVVHLRRPDVVLLDLWMPVLSGEGFFRALREQQISLNIVLMSAGADPEELAAEFGAISTIAKPFDLSQLLSVVQRCLPAGAST